MRRLRFALALAPLLLASARAADAAVLLVPTDYPTIQAALDAAITGDSVFIRPGVYNESLKLTGKDVLVHGEPGGVVITTGGTARLFGLGSGVTGATVLEQLIFREGLDTKGGAIYLHDGAAATIQTCRFINNTARVPTGSSFGGAIAIDPGSAAKLDSCSFASNFAGSGTFDQCAGGAIFVGSAARLIAERCVFFQNGAAGFEGGNGGAVASSDDARVEIQGCEFVRNGGGYGGAISATGGLRVERSRFSANSGTYGGAAIQNNGYLSDVTITGNVFVDNDAVGGPALELFGPGELSNNTIAFNGPGFVAGGIRFGGGLRVVNNIVAQNGGVGITCTEPSPVIACNDVWKNAAGNYGGLCGDLTGIDGNINENPLFCDPDIRVFTLSESSPCLPSGSCGLMGALGIGCPPLSVPGNWPAGPAVRFLPMRPNPATAPLRFTFELARGADVRLEVFDLVGRRVASIDARGFDAGAHGVDWDGRTTSGTRLGPGVYVAVLHAGDVREAQRFVLTR